MKNIILVLSILCSNIHAQSSITYLDDNAWGGRLGDKLIMFTKAKWVAHYCNLPFYYKPFKYSDNLAMHDLELQFSPKIKQSYRSTQQYEIVHGPLEQYISSQANKLYIIHYFFGLPDWTRTQELYDSQEIMLWSEMIHDQSFINELKKVIRPRNSSTLSIFTPPADKLSVAVHVRKGGGFDHPLISPQIYDLNSLSDLKSEARMTKGEIADKVWPLKFVPDQFYIDQIKRLSELCNDIPMYVHIYTDDLNPKNIITLYTRMVNKPNITFDCRETNNHHDLHVLEDMFSIANYDCLIRGGSNFPQIAQLIGNHKIVIYPLSCKWSRNTLVIDEVGTYIHPDAHQLIKS
jgi:hypothetical protein